mgnify:CR=1 FL=1
MSTGEKLNVTELDFDQIKSNLVEYFKTSDSDFTDWDFEGSNLNTILDMLAYNTHYNAMTAHLALNESFIDSAQLRSSVVSAAKLLSYTPRSVSASSVVLEGIFNASENAPPRLTLERGTRFGVSGNDSQFNYVLLDNVINLNLENGYYIIDEETSDEFRLYEGRLVSTSFPANGSDNSTRYEISDTNIDISTLKVRVYPTQNKAADTPAVFNQWSNEINATKNSLIYFISENSFGRYEIQFGNDSFGRALRSGNLINVEYLTTSGSKANGIKNNFTLNSPIPYIINSESFRVVRPTDSGSYGTSGGSEKENLTRLKQNATGSFVTQNRAVTAEDYRNIISSNFQYVENVSVWGGEANIPPIYGKTFISCIPHGNYNGSFITEGDKQSILSYLSDRKILSILPEMVDPEFVDIKLDIQFKYDPNLLNESRSELISNIKNDVLDEFNKTKLNTFDTIFRHSALQKTIDNYHPSILNSLVRVYVHKKISVPSDGLFVLGDNELTRPFGVPLTSNEGKALVSVSTNVPWTVNGEVVYIGNRPTLNPNIYELYTYSIEDKVEQIRREIGYITLTTGIITFTSNIFSDEDIIIDFTATPKSNDIVGARNLVLLIDTQESRIRGYIDEIASGGLSRSIKYQPFNRE